MGHVMVWVSKYSGSCARGLAKDRAAMRVHTIQRPCNWSTDLVRFNVYCVGGARPQVEARSGLPCGYLVRVLGATKSY